MSASIQDFSKKLKGLLKDDIYFYALLIIVTGVLSFGLGRLSVGDSQGSARPQVVLTTQPAASIASDLEAVATPSLMAKNSQLVASKKGTKYHLLTCPGTKQMSEENKVYFDSEADARAAGYTPAKNCKF